MRIPKDSWHAQLYVRMYLSGPVSKEIGAEEERAAARARFEQGRLALCPYFWGIVAALPMVALEAVFGRVEKAMNAMGQSFDRFSDRLGAWLQAWAGRNVRFLRLLALVAFAAVGLWLTSAFTRALNETIVEHDRVAERQAVSLQMQGIDRLRAAWYEARREAWLKTAEGQAWLKDEAKRVAEWEAERAARDAAYARGLEELRLAQLRINAEQEAWLNSREHKVEVAQAIAATAASDARVWQMYAERAIADYEGYLSWAERAIIGCLLWLALRLLLTVFAGRLRVMGQGLAASAASIARFSSETWTLVAQFAQAKKEKVCPYIQFVETDTPQT